MRRTKKDLDMESMFQKIMPSATTSKADPAAAPGQISTKEPIGADDTVAATSTPMPETPAAPLPTAPAAETIVAAVNADTAAATSTAPAENMAAPIMDAASVAAPVKTAHILKAMPAPEFAEATAGVPVVGAVSDIAPQADEAQHVTDTQDLSDRISGELPIDDAVAGAAAGAPPIESTSEVIAASASDAPVAAPQMPSAPVPSAPVEAAPAAVQQTPIPISVDAVVTHTAAPAPSPIGTVPIAVAATVTVAAAVAATSAPEVPTPAISAPLMETQAPAATVPEASNSAVSTSAAPVPELEAAAASSDTSPASDASDASAVSTAAPTSDAPQDKSETPLANNTAEQAAPAEIPVNETSNADEGSEPFHTGEAASAVQPDASATPETATTALPEDELPAPVLVNLARPFLESRLDAALAKFQCCTCENCQLDVLAVALNKVRPQYVLLSEGIDPLTQVSAILAREAVTALVQSILLIKVHPRH